jgi:hypothetical protein
VRASGCGGPRVRAAPCSASEGRQANRPVTKTCCHSPCRRALTAVYQLHAGAINALSVGEGLALTASDDGTLRLWPLDFR